MKHVLTLLRVQRIMGWRSLIGRIGGRSKFGFLILPLLGMGFVPLIGMLGAFYAGLFAAGKALGSSEMVLVMALTAGQMVCLTFGIFYMISSFYYAKDLPVLIPMPIRPSEIVLAKFIGIMTGEYMTMAPLVAPALLIYGVLARVGPLYWPLAVLIYLLLPVVPLALASVISILLMRITNLRRNRDLWRVVGALIGVALGVGFQFFSRLAGRNSFAPGNQQMQQLVQAQQGLVTKVGQYVPTSLWATNALREGAPNLGLPAFLLFAAVAVAAFLLMIWAAEKLFFGGLIGGDEVRSSGKVLTSAELAQQTGRVRRPLWALLQREMKMLNRTPSFLMAAVLPLILIPLMILLPLLQEKQLVDLIGKVGSFAGHPLIPAIGLGAILLMSSMNTLAATAISREGKYFWISRSLPVLPRIQITAKVLHTMIFSALNIFVVMGMLAYLRLLTPATGVWVAVGGIAVSAAAAFGGVIIDVVHPYLRWTDPQQAMKGNLNGLFNLIATLVIGLLGVVVTVVLYLFARSLLLPVLVLAYAGLAYGLYRAAGSLANRKYLEYEE